MTGGYAFEFCYAFVRCVTCPYSDDMIPASRNEIIDEGRRDGRGGCLPLCTQESNSLLERESFGSGNKGIC